MVDVNYFEYLFKYLRFNISFELPEEIFLLILVDKRRESLGLWFLEFYYWLFSLNLRLI